ncbi:hypothetical protein RI367_005726 [Sorochytrium milnesiophthora]
MTVSGAVKVSLQRLQNVKLTPVKDAAGEIMSQTLWQDQPALVVLLRRPGCLFCRNEAVELRKRAEEINKNGNIRMVAIVNQKLGAEDFADNFWQGETYFDHDLGLFKALGDGEVRRASLWELLRPSVLARIVKGKMSGPQGNLEGDGTMLGGLLVVRKGDAGVEYAYLEQTFGDIAPVEDVVKACQAAHA